MRKNNIILFLLLLLPIFKAEAQLPAFNLSVTAVNETCTGNGQLQLTVTNTTVGASMFYSIYQSPDFTTPIAVVNTNFVLGLGSGNYRVVALQTLGSESNSQTADIVIADRRESLIYQAVAQPLNCISGNIEIDVSQGNPFTYEIIAGPVIVAPQASNLFTNLPLGEYTVKVTDVCGDAIVQSCTLLYVFVPQNLIMPSSTRQKCELVDCNTAQISFSLRAVEDSIIAYPFLFTLTVFPPDGASPVVIERYINSGDLEDQSFDFNIPFYENPNVSISIKITDPCGNVINGNQIPVTRNPTTFALRPQPDGYCYKQIGMNMCNMKFPVTISFVQTPPGFDPTLFNAEHPGPFNESFVEYSSDDTNVIPDGFYTVRATDACGRTFLDTIEVKDSQVNVQVDAIHKYFEDCILYFPVLIGSIGVHPATVIVTHAPAGFEHPVPYDYSFAINKYGEFNEPFSVPGEYTISGIDVCGRPYEQVIFIPYNKIFTEIYTFASHGCGANGSVRIRNGNAPPIGTVMITEAPTAYEHQLPYDISVQMDPEHPTNDFTFDLLNPGDYTIVVTDVCGRIYETIHITILQELFPGPPNFSILEGCEIGNGSIRVEMPSESRTELEFIEMLTAPSTFNQPLPYDVSFNIRFGIFSMNGLPEGDYSFRVRDKCGVESSFSLTIGNHFFDTQVELDGNCGSFNLFLHNSAPPFTDSPIYVLHRYNPNTGSWGHPLTNFPFATGAFPNGQNSYFLSDNNYNIAAQGKFRVLKINYIYPNGSTGNANLLPCLNLLNEFEFNATLQITNAYKIACAGGNSQVVIVAGDTAPLTYEIIEKNGQPFYVDNQQMSLFTGLLPGLYKFQVKDLCGNIVTRLFDVNALSEPVVTASQLCDNQIGQLSVAPFSFLNYQWWKAGDPGTILSTTNILHFTPFLMNSTPGTYYVRVYSDSVLSCADMTIAYTIPVANDPRAGNDNTIIMCNNTSLDLNTLLSGQFDTNGFWNENTSSGMLNGHYWLPVGIQPGSYEFQYTVNGFCGTSDSALITINFTGTAPTPIASFQNGNCDGVLAFNVEPIPGATYQWTGPNGFTSNLQNPTITEATAANGGNYTITAHVNGCQSTATIEVTVQTLPVFKIVSGCIAGVYTVSALPIQESFTASEVTYNWSGPSGFSSSQNPIQISGHDSGIYQVVVTDSNGCTASRSTLVTSTSCSIPNVISPNGDQTNDYFDLSAFDVSKLEIYSRWGRLVYEQSNYTNQWYGQNTDNKELPDSTYYYIIYLKTGQEETGWIYKTSWNR